MENQHRKITGYRELSATEIQAMNDIKELADKVGALVESFDGPVPCVDGEGSIFPDPDWLAIAKTDLQKGFMALTRSIAQPTSF